MPPPALPHYAELHCLSNFTFLRGASHPQELVARAKASEIRNSEVDTGGAQGRD